VIFRFMIRYHKMFRKDLLFPFSVCKCWNYNTHCFLQNIGYQLPAITRRHRVNMNRQSGLSHTEAENLIFSYLFQTICENNLVGLLVCAVGNYFLFGFLSIINLACFYCVRK
jgi:hypothetical protein